MNPLSQKRPAKVGGLFDNIINAVTTGYGIYANASAQSQAGSAGACRAPAGCLQCRVSGQGDIAGCLDLLWTRYTSTMNTAALSDQLAFLQAFNAAVNNDAYFAQNSPFEYLANTKREIPINIARVQALIASGSQTPTGTVTPMGTVTNPVTGAVTYVNAPASGGVSVAGIQLDTNTVLIGVLGLGAIVLLMKK